MLRSRTDRIFGGVLGGAAQARGWSPWIVRAAFVLVFGVSLQVNGETCRLMFGVAGLVVYGALWALVPLAPRASTTLDQ